jgi:hypothetical protein
VQIVESPAGEPADAARQARIRLVSAAPIESADGVVRMPDVHGKTKRQVLALLAPLRVEVDMTGRGSVVQQDPAPGTPLDPGLTVRLTLDAPGAARQAEGPPSVGRGAEPPPGHAR